MDELYTCNKRWYATRREAMNALRNSSQQRYVKTGRSLRPYHCKCCGGWHLTSITPAAWQQRRRRLRREAQVQQREIEEALHGGGR